MDRPTLFLHSAAWVSHTRRRKSWPEGYSRSAWTAMPRPRRDWGQHGRGLVYHLLPDVRSWHRARLPDTSHFHVPLEQALREYDGWMCHWARMDLLRPGQLFAFDSPDYYDQRRKITRLIPLKDGDVVFTGDGRVAALEGRCHRAWMSWHLASAGWRVVLEGERELQLDEEGAIVASVLETARAAA